jgi:cytochrome c nitrite reductase small subunit
LKKAVLIVGIAIVVIVTAGVALWNYHEQPQFCATCHIMQPYLDSWEWPPLLAHAHAEENITCLECHEPTIQQQAQEGVKYVTKDYQNPLKEREFPKEWCFRCHEHGSYEQLIELTKDYTVDGEQINPHAYRIDPQAPDPEAYTVDSEAPDPHDSEQGELECYQCHKIHKESPGLTSCYECHHDAFFFNCSVCHKEWNGADLLGQAHAEADVTCLDCHEPTIQQQVQEGIQVATKDFQAAFAAEREFAKESCLRCHEHESYEQLIELTKDYTVQGEKVNPHAYRVDPEAPDPEAYTVDPEAPNPHDSEQGELECNQCHNIHKESPGLNSCYECHHDAIFLKCSVCHKE